MPSNIKLFALAVRRNRYAFIGYIDFLGGYPVLLTAGVEPILAFLWVYPFFFLISMTMGGLETFIAAKRALAAYHNTNKRPYVYVGGTYCRRKGQELARDIYNTERTHG